MGAWDVTAVVLWAIGLGGVLVVLGLVVGELAQDAVAWLRGRRAPAVVPTYVVLAERRDARVFRENDCAPPVGGRGAVTTGRPGDERGRTLR